MEIRGMQPHELPQVHRMLDLAFPHTPSSFFDQQVKNDPMLRPEDTRVLVDHGEIRACIRIYFRTIYCRGEELRMGGIGDVGTHPEHQGKGYASMLMNDAIGYMRKHRAVVSFLFTRINTFYEKSGYFTLPTLDLLLEPPRSLKSLPYRLLDLERDVTFLQNLYERYNREQNGPVIRDPKYWKCQI